MIFSSSFLKACLAQNELKQWVSCLFETYDPTGFSFSCRMILEKDIKGQGSHNSLTMTKLYLLILIFIWDVFSEEIRNSWTLLYQFSHVWLYIRLYAVKVFIKMENGSEYVLILNTVEMFVFKNVLRGLLFSAYQEALFTCHILSSFL